jgi:serine/threonine protein kinase
MLTRTHLVVIVSYASGGALNQYIRERGPLSEDVARFFFRQLIAAVEAMHESGLYHRDLKLEHALIDIVGVQQDIRLQICDFGVSKHEFMDSSLKSGELALSLSWLLALLVFREALQKWMEHQAACRVWYPAHIGPLSYVEGTPCLTVWCGACSQGFATLHGARGAVAQIRLQIRGATLRHLGLRRHAVRPNAL